MKTKNIFFKKHFVYMDLKLYKKNIFDFRKIDRTIAQVGKYT